MDPTDNLNRDRSADEDRTMYAERLQHAYYTVLQRDRLFVPDLRRGCGDGKCVEGPNVCWLLMRERLRRMGSDGWDIRCSVYHCTPINHNEVDPRGLYDDDFPPETANVDVEAKTIELFWF